MRASTLQPRAHLALARALAWAPPLGAIAAALLSFGTGGVCLPALASLLALHALSVLGLRVGYHRLFTHRRFAAGPGLRVTLAVLGGLAGQGPLLAWVDRHRARERGDLPVPARDLARDPALALVDRLYPLWLGLGFLAPAALVGLATRSPQGALEGLLWGGLVRLFVLQQLRGERR